MKLRAQVNRAKSFFVQKGWLTKNGDRILTMGCLVFIGIPLWLIYTNRINALLGFFLILVGIFLGAVVGYEGKAKQFGFEAPFTNDPLGWRKAKESYKAEHTYAAAKKDAEP